MKIVQKRHEWGQREILELLKSLGQASYEELRVLTKKPFSSLSVTMHRLVEKGLVERKFDGRKVVFKPRVIQ